MKLNNSGFVKLPRKIIDEEWFSDSRSVQVMIALLLLANYEDTNKVKKGVVGISKRALGTLLDMDIKTLNKILKGLQVNVSSNGNGTQIYLPFYNEWQSMGLQGGKPIGNSVGKPTLKIPNTKEVEEETEEDIENIVWEE